MTTHAEGVEGPGPRPTGPGSQPADPVQRWVAQGIITAEQAAAIRADLTRQPGLPPTPQPALPPTGPASPSAHASLLAEALGYLGGALIVVALGIATGRFWENLSTVSRLGLFGVATAGMFAAGRAVPLATAPAARRLRSVLWLVSTGLLAWFLGIAADAGGLHDADLLLVCGAGTGGYAALLWWRHHLLLQHLALITALTATVAPATAHLPDADTSPSAAVWALGVGWYLLGWSAVLRPRREVELIGAAVTAGSTLFFAPELWGTPLALSTLVAMAVLAVRVHDLALLGIDAVAALVVLPAIVTRYFPGALSAAAALLVVGVLLVLAGVVTVRRRGQPVGSTAAPVTGSPETSWTGGTPRAGWLSAGLVVGVTVAALLLTALV